MSNNVKDVLMRALKTFWQSALAAAILSVGEIAELAPSGWEALKPLLLSVAAGAIAAGLSAAYNGALKPFLAPKIADDEWEENGEDES